MSKVASYFKRWNKYSRHKADLSEEWAFAVQSKDFIDGRLNETNDRSTEFDVFTVKFLGSINIDVPNSEEATALAIKSITSIAKSKKKRSQRLNLYVGPNGIESFDVTTGESVHRISINKISYCSADAVHRSVFAFISSAPANDLLDNDDEILTCYAFACSKRSVVQHLAITVAKYFEQAYTLWKEREQIKKIRCDVNVMATKHPVSNCVKMDSLTNSLINFYTEDVTPLSDIQRKSVFPQNTWVSFDDADLMPRKSFDSNW